MADLMQGVKIVEHIPQNDEERANRSLSMDIEIDMREYVQGLSDEDFLDLWPDYLSDEIKRRFIKEQECHRPSQ